MGKNKTIAEERLFKTFKKSWYVEGARWFKRNLTYLLLGAAVATSSYFLVRYMEIFQPSGSELASNYQKELEKAKPDEYYLVVSRMLQEKNPEVLRLATEQLVSDKSKQRLNASNVFQKSVPIWKSWPKEEAHQQVRLVSEQLARINSQLPAPQQRLAVNLAQAFMMWPKSDNPKFNSRLLGYCEKILKDSDVGPYRLVDDQSADSVSPDSRSFGSQSNLLFDETSDSEAGRRIAAQNASFSKAANAGTGTPSSEVPLLTENGTELSIHPVDPSHHPNLTGGLIGVRIANEGEIPEARNRLFGQPKPLNSAHRGSQPIPLQNSSGSPGSAFRQLNPGTNNSQPKDTTDWGQLESQINRPGEVPKGSGEFPQTSETPPNPTLIPTVPNSTDPMRNPSLNRLPTVDDRTAMRLLKTYRHIDVMKLLRSADKKTQELANKELQRRGFKGAFLTAANQIVSSDPKIRLQLVFWLQENSSEISIPFLKWLATDQNHQVRSAAIQVLKQFPDPQVQRFAMKRELETVKATKLPILSER